MARRSQKTGNSTLKTALFVELCPGLLDHVAPSSSSEEIEVSDGLHDVLESLVAIAPSFFVSAESLSPHDLFNRSFRVLSFRTLLFCFSWAHVFHRELDSFLIIFYLVRCRNPDDKLTRRLIRILSRDSEIAGSDVRRMSSADYCRTFAGMRRDRRK